MEIVCMWLKLWEKTRGKFNSKYRVVSGKEPGPKAKVIAETKNTM